MTFEAVALQLKRGGDAFIIEHAGDSVTLASTSPAPPGSTLEATYAAAICVTVRVKVRGCRRAHLPDGREGFRVEGRLVSMTRADREALFGSRVETDPGSISET